MEMSKHFEVGCDNDKGQQDKLPEKDIENQVADPSCIPPVLTTVLPELRKTDCKRCSRCLRQNRRSLESC